MRRIPKLGGLAAVAVLFSSTSSWAQPVQSRLIYAGTQASGVLRSLDGGATWEETGSPSPPAGPIFGLAVDPNAAGTVYAGSIGVFKSVDAGNTWMLLNRGPAQPFVLTLALDPSTNTTVYAGTLADGLLKSKDGGATWQTTGFPIGTVNAVVVDPRNSSIVYAGGPSGIFRSGDGGATFVQNADVAEVNGIAFDPRDSATLYVASSKGIYKTLNGGTTWVLLNCACVPADAAMVSIAVDPLNPTTIYAGGSNPSLNAFIVKSADAGSSWTPVNSGLVSEQIQSLVVSGTSVLAGAQGPHGLFLSGDGASTWSLGTDAVLNGAEVLSLAGPVVPSIPLITAVFNSAGFQPSIQNNSWVTIRGVGLSSTTRIWDPAREIIDGQLPASLDGVSVTINAKSASMYFISPTQINVLAPVDAAIGLVPVQVTNSGKVSLPVSVQMQREAPAFFVLSPPNQNYPAATQADGTLLGPPSLFGPAAVTKPGRVGDVILLYGTGCGPTDPPLPSGRLFSGVAVATDPVTVAIGGMSANIQFAGMSAPGICQFNVVIPSVPDGDQPIVATVNGQTTQPNLLVNITH